MTPPTDRARRAGRAGLASTFAVLVALAAHLAGGGTAPAPGPLVAVLALGWPVATLLIGARPRLWRQALVLGLTQAALHGLFALGDAADAPAPASGPMAGMPGMGTAALPAGAPGPMAHQGAAMWGWHVLAWLVTTLAWSRGEAALQRLLERLPRRLALLVVAVPAPAAPRVVALPAAPRTPSPVVLAPPPRRGPPLPV